MSKILFITDFYYPRPTSIGISTHKITKELCDNGNEVHVLCYGDKNMIDVEMYEGVQIHYIKYRIYDRLLKFSEKNFDKIIGKVTHLLAMLLIRIPGLLYLGLYPMNSITNINSIYKMIKKLHRNYNYDVVVSTYSPFDGLIAGYLLKKKNKNLLFVLYVLDTLSNRGKSKWFSRKWTEKMGYKWEQRIYPYADAILNMKCHENHHKKNRYKPYADKMYIVDIPLFEMKNNEDETKSLFDSTNKHFVYTGRVLSHLTDPIYLCELFLRLCKDQDYNLHFFSSGDCEKTIIHYQKKANNKIIREGLVDRDTAIKALNDSDVLISIGCAESMKVPSKIFDYMSAKKKIIHFKKGDLDVALEYYKKYPLALIISEEDSYEMNIKKIHEFLSVENSFDSLENLEEIFKINKANHTASIIEQVIKINTTTIK